MNSSIYWNIPDAISARRERTLVIGIVTLLHFAVIALWLMQPSASTVPRHQMEITMTMLAAPVVVQPNQPLAQTPARISPVWPAHIESPAPTPLPVEVAEQPRVIAEAAAIPPESAALAAAAAVVKPVEAVLEPDFKASYLNNRLTYPLAARRLGIQGKVVLNVEVLAAGISGQVNVQQSSGQEMLDRAAVESVRNWRFVPARRGAQPITRWFKVPITFSLKDNET